MLVSAQVLDLTHGRPAVDVHVRLECAGAAGWRLIGSAKTDDGGRVDCWDEPLIRGAYRLTVEAGRFFSGLGITSAQSEIVIDFVADQEAGRYHVPVLLAPFGFTIYAGLTQ